MIQILVISENADLPDAVRALLSAPDDYECHGSTDIDSTLHLLPKPLFNICLLDTDLTGVLPIRKIKNIRKANPTIPLIVLAGAIHKEWEEEAILHGADFVLRKPLRGPVLQKIVAKSVASTGRPHHEENNRKRPPHDQPQTLAPQIRPLPALEILRDFSRIFSYSFNLKSFTYQFALKLREIISVNRIAIFLEQGKCSPFGTPANDHETSLKCLCSVGIEQELFDYLTLSPRAGIGQAVLKSGRILRSTTTQSNNLFPADPDIQREFDLLGGQIAIPIVDRERTIGVAVLGDRLMGQSFSNEELQLLFHLMEELGLAIKSNQLHDQLVSNHKLISSVFSQMSNGCLVVDHDLNILHSNPALLSFLNLPDSPVQFSNLPQKLAALLYESAHNGKRHDPFLYQPAPEQPQVFRISTIPFQGENNAAGAMMFVEDVTLIEAARKTELETSKLRVIAIIAERFAHEIRNSLVALNTNRQLMSERITEESFQKSLEQSLAQETARISRLADHLLYLSQKEFPLSAMESVRSLLQEAFSKAKAVIQGNPELEISETLDDIRIICNSSGLKHAFFEILLNGFQADLTNPKVTISSVDNDGSNLILEFRDQGAGIPPQIAGKAMEAFFTTRNVGVGLGLTVAQRILEAHQGKLEINNRGRLIASLPVSAPSLS